MKIKSFLVIFLILLLISINSISNAKYIFDFEFDVADLNIDRTKPKIEYISVYNNNLGYEKYANKTHIIKVNVKVTEKNIGQDILENDEIKLKVNDKFVNNSEIVVKLIEKNADSYIYEITLKNLTGNGLLDIVIEKGAITDLGGLESDQLLINTGITIDNIAPETEFSEEEIEKGRVNGVIDSNEPIRTIEGWNVISDTKFKKEFLSNTSYIIQVVDYAQNISNLNIDITKATYIKIVYASHNSQIGWSYGYGNYDVAGKEAVLKDPTYKTEALAFNFEGNVDKDFIKARAFVYTHWGEGTKGKCATTGLIYNYGYNPSKTSWKSMNSNDLIKVDGRSYFQFGGSMINGELQTDINGNNPIPIKIANEYRYGVSGITLQLKDDSYYSIVYQILVDDVGWVKACADGQECMYSYDKPMSAFRMTLVPKSEKNYVVNMWNKDVGTFNMK